ncbi:hypothetical protein [Stenotrophomonas sp. PS02297]|uniref:hypothetical protein n=1 Tax=Stenotrophomonas sp. PS02297 TaxID=2991423 RepID=UPI00249BC517|nr:hypothetical protein [Stenotrophomonas sp. PS02297]
MHFDIAPVVGLFYRLTGVLVFAIVVGLLAAVFSRGLGKKRQHAIMQLAFTATLILGALLFVL